uniref:PAC domain-containing protein n=1 Tax=Nymphaea colorata TaxID=210225 RepID=A0A5K0VIQ5_9MAGN
MEGNGPVVLVVNACLLKDLKEDVVGVSLIAQDVTSEKIVMENFIRVQGVGITIIHNPCNGIMFTHQLKKD